MPSSKSINKLLGTSIDDGRFELLRLIGKGGFGCVLLAHDTQDHKLVAIKALSNKGLDVEQRSLHDKEFQLHHLCSSHPNVLTIHQMVKSRAYDFLVLDYVAGKDLFDRIGEGRFLGRSPLISMVFLQILDAIGHCHALGVSHRDIKPENILCGQDGAQMLLADFGLATVFERCKDFNRGSTSFMSPECQAGLFDRPESYDSVANDVWSLGIILCTLVVGSAPWTEASIHTPHFRRFIVDPRSFLEDNFPFSEEALSLLLLVFKLDPKLRISLPELVEKVKRVKKWSTLQAVASDDSKLRLFTPVENLAIPLIPLLQARNPGGPITPPHDPNAQQTSESSIVAETPRSSTTATPSVIATVDPTIILKPTRPSSPPRSLLGFGSLFGSSFVVAPSSRSSTSSSNTANQSSDSDSESSGIIDDLTGRDSSLLDEQHLLPARGVDLLAVVVETLLAQVHLEDQEVSDQGAGHGQCAVSDGKEESRERGGGAGGEGVLGLGDGEGGAFEAEVAVVAQA